MASSDDAEDFYGLDGPTETILRALMAQTFPGSTVLLRQLSGSRMRRIDANGSVALIPGPATPPASVATRVPVTGRTQDADGVGIEVLLHVVDGYLSELEIYRHDGGDITAPVDPSGLELDVEPAVK